MGKNVCQEALPVLAIPCGNDLSFLSAFWLYFLNVEDKITRLLLHKESCLCFLQRYCWKYQELVDGQDRKQVITFSQRD
jgi:hypothetical protein